MTQAHTIALVNCCLPRRSNEPRGAPQGVLYVATALAADGISSHIYDTAIDLAPCGFTPESLANYFRAIPEQLIGISVWDSVLPKVVLATELLKTSDPSRIIVLGGPAASCLSNDLITRFPWIDSVVKGEGEMAFVSLLRWLASGSKRDLAKLSDRVLVRSGAEVIRGFSRTPPMSAKEIPIPDYSLLELSPYTRLEIVSTRGCPFNCSFCSVNRTGGTKLQSRYIDHLFKEIAQLVKLGRSRYIHVLDDNFGADRSRLNAFCRTFSETRSDMFWSCYFRMADLDHAMVDKLAEAHCTGVYVGVESGSDSVLNQLGKGISSKEIIERIGYASQKINVTASFIWGLPGEDMDGLRETLELVANVLDFDNVYVNLYQLSPLSGTEVYRKLSPHMQFDPAAVSGFIYPPFMAPLTEMEESLIRSHPAIFPAFYHEGGSAFWEKYEVVKMFLGE